MNALRNKYLVNALWLKNNLNDCVRLDCSWHLPTTGRVGRDEFSTIGHIPGARFFDIDDISDKSNPYPHALPSGAVFAEKISRLGVSRNDRVVLYDSLGMVSVARAWYMFKGFGHDNVCILDGGLRAWKDAGGELKTTCCEIEPTTYPEQDFDKELFRDFETVIETSTNKTELIVDARPAARFKSEAPEPRPEVKSGKIDNSFSVPASCVVDSNGLLLSNDALIVTSNSVQPRSPQQALFRENGVQETDQRRMVVSCGSGVTACVTGFAAYVSGVSPHIPALFGAFATAFQLTWRNRWLLDRILVAQAGSTPTTGVK